MTKKSPSSKPSIRKPKVGRFYIVGFSYSGERRANWEIENADVLRGSGYFLSPPKGQRGFPVSPEKPRLVIGKRKAGHPPRDMEEFHVYWLISDRLKVLLESVDSEAFAFQSCDVKLRDGSAGPVYWLCDVVRVLDALDDSTREKIHPIFGIVGLQTLSFKEDVVGDAHMFRVSYPDQIKAFCDQHLKDACKEAGIKGIGFNDCAPTRKPGGGGYWRNSDSS